MMRTSVFRLSPFLLLAAALVALAVLFVQDSPRASADHAREVTVWSATLTVGNILTNTLVGCDDGNVDCSTALTDDSFSYAGTTYRVTEAQIHVDGRFWFGADKVMPAELDALSLIVDGETLPLATATVGGQVNQGDNRLWENSGLSWSVGDTVSLRLAVVPVHPTVSLSASPNPVTPQHDPDDPDLKKNKVTITATLSSPLPEVVWIPVTLDQDASNPDHGVISTIGIRANELTGSHVMGVFEDVDTVDDTFTVSLDTAKLPATVVAGSPTSVTVTIQDSDPKGAPGSVSNFTVTSKVRHLLLTWNKPTGRITHYEAQFKEAAAPDQTATSHNDPSTGWVAMNRWTALKTDDPATASTTDNTSGRITVLPDGLTAGTAYSVRLRAVNWTANGPWATKQGTPKGGAGGI